MSDDYDNHYKDETEQEAQLRAEKAQADLLAGLGHTLHAKAMTRVSERRAIEDRWIRNTRQLNGQYDPETQARLDAAQGSKVFVNITRKMSNTAESRLLDILFPTDDRNWSIQPTPIPFLVKMADDETPVTHENGHNFVTDKGVQVEQRDIAAGQIEEAKERASAMQEEIDDQLNEANYNASCRDVAKQAVRLGTGVLKGPVVHNKTRKSWVNQTDESGNSVHVMHTAQELKPGAEFVDVWDFFPDMSARSIEQSPDTFQRHHMTKKDLVNLARDGVGFIKDQIAQVLLTETELLNTSNHLEQLRNIAGVSGIKNSTYEVWEYHGPITKQALRACGVDVEYEEDEVFKELEGVVWLTEKHVIKAVISPSDTEEMPYSVFCWEEDDTSIFGFGIPQMMEDSQKVMNGTWRMVMDNGALSAGPQVVIDDRTIEPADGNYTLTGRKVWKKTDPAASLRDAFGVFNIDGHTSELLALFEFARGLADEETAIPQIAQGEQGDASDTYNGMKILMNSANTMMRRVVKNWDDNITRTHIKRMYDWNMQFNAKEEIKGDYAIDARGASSLLVKEEQARNLMSLMNMAASPLLEPLTDVPELYRKVVSSMQLEAKEIVKSNEQIKTAGEQQMQQQQQILQAQTQQKADQGDPLAMKKLELMQMKQQADVELKFMAIEAKNEELKFKRENMMVVREVDLAKLAADQNMRVSDLKTKLGIKQLDVRSKDSLFEKEQALKLRVGSGI